MSQKTEILTYLREGHSLTALLALAKFRCNRLAARIRTLRADGWGITTEMVTTPVTRKRVARYTLTDPAQKEPTGVPIPGRKGVARYTLTDPAQKEPTGVPMPGRKAKPTINAAVEQVERELEHTKGGKDWKEGARWALEQVKRRQ